LYWQVADDILAKIEAGVWQSGTKLPSEREMCERYDVSQITVRRALRELEHLERVHSQHGIGWFVSSGTPAQDLREAALVVPGLDWPAAELAQQLSTRLLSHGVGLRLAVVDEASLPEERVLSVLSDQGAELLLVIPGGAERGATERYDGLLASLDTASLLLFRSFSEAPIPSLALDESAAMCSLTQHLLSLGHRRVAYLGASPALIAGHASYWGFATALWEQGLELPLDWIFSAGLDGSESERLQEMLVSTEGPTALVCASDLLAAEAIACLSRTGMRCPADVAVVGCGDQAFGRTLATPLTTYRLDIPSLVQAGVTAALALLSGSSVESQTFSGELVIRSSCGAHTR
jgi:DNA-binding LacI/PurR family transcriptional regulator